jgi:hypothetical protein
MLLSTLSSSLYIFRRKLLPCNPLRRESASLLALYSIFNILLFRVDNTVVIGYTFKNLSKDQSDQRL